MAAAPHPGCRANGESQGDPINRVFQIIMFKIMFKIATLILSLAAGHSLLAASSSIFVQSSGADFQGGAKDLYGTSFDGEEVNTIYAAPTGSRSRMHADFELRALPNGPQFLHLKGRDDDGPEQSRILIELNGATLFKGRNTFASPDFQVRKFAIPPGTLRKGTNTLAISCQEQEGRTGMPPWFQAAGFGVGPENWVMGKDLRRNFIVTLPTELRPFPEPLPEGVTGPGFKFRGTKGWMWTPEQYLAEIPYLKKFKMNFLMTCYLSWFDLENNRSWSGGDANRWYEDIPEWKKEAYTKVIRECDKNDILFCFGMNPNFASKRMVNDGAPDSVDLLYKHYAWAQGLGVKWFNISLDDITEGIDAVSQAKVVNEIFSRLRANDPDAQMIFCPTYYWGDGTEKEQQPYLELLKQHLDKDVYLFWTGNAVVGRITREATETFRRISGRRLFLWDNYPVNDDTPAMHLGPVIDRDADLCELIDGYMANPHCKQNEINRIPLATCADYAWNPWNYDPQRSINQAVAHLASSGPQRELLKDLVETYPGFLVYGSPRTSFNAVRDQFLRISGAPHSRQAAIAFIKHMESLSERLKNEFPDSYQPEKQTLEDDIEFLKRSFTAKFGKSE
jgi:hypothetical protein